MYGTPEQKRRGILSILRREQSTDSGAETITDKRIPLNLMKIDQRSQQGFEDPLGVQDGRTLHVLRPRMNAVECAHSKRHFEALSEQRRAAFTSHENVLVSDRSTQEIALVL